MIFPKGFFLSENREDFPVEEMMKRAWAAALEILESVTDICQRHGISWYADWGTLLGCVRHRGFIPWDDDIDISMLRKDYNQLIPLLSKELPEGFVITGMYSENDRLFKAGRVAQLRVMADEMYFPLPSYMNRFHGFPYPRIGIDIFPLDYIDDGKDSVQMETLTSILKILTHWDELSEDNNLNASLDILETKTGHMISRDADTERNLWLLFDELCASNKSGTSVSNFATRILEKDYRIPAKAFDETIQLPFEFVSLSAPAGYDDVLAAEYGEYMTPVRNLAAHDYPFYKNQEAEFIRMLSEAGIGATPTEFCRNWQRARGEE